MHFTLPKINKISKLKFDNFNINSTKTTKFLGITLDQDLNWKAHCSYVNKKLNSSLFSIKRLKNILSVSVLKTLYYSLFECHLTYGILTWGNTFKYILKPLLISQKKALRCIFKKPYNHPTMELYTNNKILSIENLYNLHLCKLMYKYYNNLLPVALNNIFVNNNNIHGYNTRFHNEPHRFLYKKDIVCRSFLVKAPLIWNSLPIEIKTSPNIKLFNKRTKKHLLSVLIL